MGAHRSGEVAVDGGVGAAAQVDGAAADLERRAAIHLKVRCVRRARVEARRRHRRRQPPVNVHQEAAPMQLELRGYDNTWADCHMPAYEYSL